ncbi:hypothetical protein NC652_028343 [Populus alba x Populus x berolinensis]|nr:hypothetical protein NC652_028343 [Populus alba x Populus x berolinensis]
MIEWVKQLNKAFGASFLWLICLIYFTQGFRSFVWTAVSYQLKDNLKLSPSASQFVSSIAFFPWSIKPLYGILSDCIPIKGRKRIPYLVIATLLSLVPWPMLGIHSNLRSSQWHLTVLLTVHNLGSAMADVVVDAMIAEAVRSERASFSGDLQSISWLSMAVGGIWGSLLGGHALTNLQIDKIFLLFSVLPAIQLLSCGLVGENSAASKVSHESANSSNSHPVNGNGNILDEDNILLKKSSASATRRKRSQKNSNKRASMRTKSLIPEKGDSLISRWFHSLKTATYSLLRAFRQPIILRPMAWFFLAQITVPNLSTVMFYYQTEVLNLDASFLGTARVVGWLGLMLGTFTYNRYLKTMKLRKILLWAHVGLSLLTLLDVILVSRLNLAYGVSDKIMVVFGSALFDAVNQFKSFVWTAVSYQLKDNLKLSPSASQFVSSIAFFPWSIKPLYGILSDCIPIKGRKRIPYLVIATLLSLVPWPMLGIHSNLRSSQWHLTVLLTVQNLGSAMADVVVDAMIAEAVRSERASFSGDLQSITWLSIAVGGIWGSLLGGHALTNLQIDKIFLLFSVLPAIQLLSCGLVGENSADSKVSHESANSSNSHPGNGNGNILDEDNILLKKSSASATRRKRSQKNSNKRASMRTKSLKPEKGDSLISRWFHSLKTATYGLLRAFRQPIILRPMAWFFLAQITVPNLSTVMFYYQTEVLNLDGSFLGTARVVGWLGLMLGTFTYNRYLKTMKLRKILLWAHIGLSLLTLLDVILVSRLNLACGVSDKIMVVSGSAVADAVNQFKHSIPVSPSKQRKRRSILHSRSRNHMQALRGKKKIICVMLMPFLILSGQLCPPGIEGTLFSLFMSINDLGSIVGSFVGAGLASILNLSSGSFDNLGLGIAIQVLCTFIPIAFLFLIPKEATGISA